MDATLEGGGEAPLGRRRRAAWQAEVEQAVAHLAAARQPVRRGGVWRRGPRRARRRQERLGARRHV